MSFSTEDIVPMSQVRARFSELAEEARDGHEKVVTRNGEGYVAIIDARQLDRYHALEREHGYLALLDEAAAGLDDVEAGRVKPVSALREKYGR